MGLASALGAAGVSVDLVARPRTAHALAVSGLRRMGVLGDVWIPPERFNILTSLALSPREAYDFVLIATKAYDADSVARQLSACPWLFAPGTRLVAFFNGIGGAEILAGYFPPERIYAARLMTGFERVKSAFEEAEPAIVNVTVHAAPVAIGNPFTADADGVEPLCAVLTAGGLPATPCKDILEEMCSKFLFNCACNPLGALFDVPIGGLASDARLRTLMERILYEAFAVMKPAGYRSHWQSADEYFSVLYGRLIPATATHRTSMWQDLRAGRRTEIDFLNGRIASLSDRFGVSAPVNLLVTQAIQSAEVQGHSRTGGPVGEVSRLLAYQAHPETVMPARSAVQ
jgi:2-dehydropantoate 2-reductase